MSGRARLDDPARMLLDAAEDYSQRGPRWTTVAAAYREAARRVSARLAAEPDLLAACEAAESDLAWVEGSVHGSNFQASLILLRAAISKARGAE